MPRFILHSPRCHPAEQTDGGYYPKHWTYSIEPQPTPDQAKKILAVRPDLRITGGFLQFNATFRGERSFTPRVVYCDSRLPKQLTTVTVD